MRAGGTAGGLGWVGIVRLGLVQTALGAIVVLATSTLNRIMVVEAGLPAIVPGLLVGLHYGIQVLRPRLGHGSDEGGRRTPWILGGMAVLGTGSILAAAATALMVANPVPGIVLGILAFGLIGLGVGSAGTSLLVLLAAIVDERRRPAAATIAWTMMIAGFAVTAGTAGRLLDPYSATRLVAVAAGVAALACLVATLAVWGIEAAQSRPAPSRRGAEPVPFRRALAEVWAEPASRRFALFVFVSMLAYSAQDLILEPYAGMVFGLSPGETTSLSGAQHAGLLAGMLLVALCGTVWSGRPLGAMRNWTAGGCLASALCTGLLAASALSGPGWPLSATVFATGVANGAFAIAAIAAMMQLVGAGRGAREGVRMGLLGAAQAVAFGLGGFAGAAVSDVGRLVLASPGPAYALVFAGQTVLFAVAAMLAARVFEDASQVRASGPMPVPALAAGG